MNIIPSLPMSLYKTLERIFEKAAASIAALFSNSLVFLAALAVIIYWFAVHQWSGMSLTDALRDIILSIMFLSFFIIQRSFSHFSQALHLKLNELVASHEKARNQIVKAEEKTDEELKALSREHDEIISQTKKGDG
jgi:low affinity Fe/Cu permease